MTCISNARDFATVLGALTYSLYVFGKLHILFGLCFQKWFPDLMFGFPAG